MLLSAEEFTQEQQVYKSNEWFGTCDLSTPKGVMSDTELEKNWVEKYLQGQNWKKI